MRLRAKNAPETAETEEVVETAEVEKTTLSVIAYNAHEFLHEEDVSLDRVNEVRADKTWEMVWLDVSSLADKELVEEVGKAYDLHELTREDIFNLEHRGKIEEYDDYFFVITHMVNDDEGIEQVSMIAGDKYLLTFQEGLQGDCFTRTRNRICKKERRNLFLKGGYLLYTILDAAIDSYFPALERLGDSLEDTEEALTKAQTTSMPENIHTYKQSLLKLRKTIWPQREVINHILASDDELVDPAVRTYFRDCYDHVVEIIDLVENNRELVSSLFDLSLAITSNRLNEVMKVLTIIATIFIPLSFIAGVYGMNFQHSKSPYNMPELDWYLGYPFALALMAIIAFALIAYFWRKGWLGGKG